MPNKHLHFIGIGGTAMAALARAFSAAGFKVTGSESGHIFPPMSDYLKNNKIKYYTPFDSKKIGQPQEIIIGNAFMSDENPEVIYARESKIGLKHFPKLVEKYLIKKKSIVVAGTYGKTTITAMMAWLLDKARKNPSYMLGGIPLNLQHGARLTPHFSKSGGWSVVEGDEYPAASPWDYSPKFAYYHPQYLILTSAEWDHMDIYKTKKSYVDTFKKLVADMPKNGIIVAKLGGENLDKVLKVAKCKVIFYSSHPDPDGAKRSQGKDPVIQGTNKTIYSISVPRDSSSPRQVGAPQNDIPKNTKFVLYKNSQKISEFETQLLGEFNLENWAASLAMAHELKIPLITLQKAVKNFKGVKRRLEIRAIKKGITVIDDFAHSPCKAKQSVKALATHFPHSKIYIIFEPNRGGRSVKCLKKYNHIFNSAHKVFIPKLTEYKKKSEVIDVSGKKLTAHLKKTHKNVVYQANSQKILGSLIKSSKPDDVIAFLGSRDFEGMIDKIVRKL